MNRITSDPYEGNHEKTHAQEITTWSKEPDLDFVPWNEAEHCMPCNNRENV